MSSVHLTRPAAFGNASVVTETARLRAKYPGWTDRDIESVLRGRLVTGLQSGPAPEPSARIRLVRPTKDDPKAVERAVVAFARVLLHSSPVTPAIRRKAAALAKHIVKLQ
jgi:hypothetical protein